MNNNSKDFVCQRCGNCCREPGYVHLSEKEIDACAAFLNLDVMDFIEKFTRLTKQRNGLSLIEQKNGSCIFLTENNECLIQAVKPLQCQQFPFTWRYKEGQEICKGWQDREKA